MATWDFVASKDFKGINTTKIKGMQTAIDAYISAVNKYYKDAAKKVDGLTKQAFVGKHRDDMNKAFSTKAAEASKITAALSDFNKKLSTISSNYVEGDVNIGKTF